MIRHPPRSTRTDTHFPDTTLFRSLALYREVHDRIRQANPDVIINLTTGPGCMFVPTPGNWTVAAEGTNMMSAEERVAHIIEIKPDISTLEDRKSTRLNSSH